MKQVNARGRLLTLKLLKRHPDAPIEPPKFLGHGWCETFNKSAPVFNKGGSATDDPAVLGTEAVKLLRAMRLDPVELRGVGIQITKLDGEAKVAEREVGQGTLSFVKKRTASEAIAMERQASEGSPKPASKIELGRTTSHAVVSRDTHPVESEISPPPRSVSPRSASPELQAMPQPPIQRNASAGPSRAGPSASSEGIDPEFLAALPPDLRHEVKRDFARTRATSEKPNTTKAPAEAEVLPLTSVSPAKAQGKHAAAHITKQLRPKLKTQLKATAVADLPLYGAWAKANDKDKEVMDLTMEPVENEMIGAYQISELVELGVDPGVFSELPEDLQKEVVKEERAKARKRKMLHRPADTSRSRVNGGRDAIRTASVSPSRSSRARSVPVQPHLTITRPAKPTLLKATSLPDVLDTVTGWIESRGGAGPAARDANKVKAYLVKCMAPEAGMGGPENAVEVLRWMRSLLRDMWASGVDGETGAGKEWWDTWAGFRDQVDRISRERFGAGIRL
jgi:DNA repair protein REV1